MSSLFFWIIILSFVVPMAMRAYRRSMARRDRDQGLPGPFSGPGQFPGPNQFPGSDQYPGYGQFPGSAGPQNRQPRDGYTQQDYFSGGFRQPSQPPQPYGGQQLPPYQHGQAPMPDPRFGGAPQEFGQEPPLQQPGYQQPQLGRPGPGQPSGPATPPPPSAPQGFRARKLAELDQQYSNGELSMEEYMKRRGDIMNG
ncbi:hypothetical protein LFT44_06350 [Arthrobacter sp. FW306-05-C]|uniref:hypothetical protein n=1 Tax=unclassified Arthrobacter TaxID=235627 RepID=UPI001EF11C1D|nr:MULTISPECIES: hypothetical protein [unclassified Arthrobacter]UKA68027.1 hypothetical protein LFT44_06350 [Arthrobacter sp. FW306-05-C]UKA76784.1 hypothetical protein LFT46_07000 [Arthrobacter sp. FW306-07-I]